MRDVHMTTARLELRPFAASDGDALFRVWGDPEVMRFIPGGARSRLEVDAMLARLRVREHALGSLAVTRIEDGRLIGVAGLVPAQWVGPEVEIMYHLARDAWGQGFATEAAAAFIELGFRERGLDRIIGLTEPDNVASQRVLAKIGLIRCGETTKYYGRRLFVHEVKAPSE